MCSAGLVIFCTHVRRIAIDPDTAGTYRGELLGGLLLVNISYSYLGIHGTYVFPVLKCDDGVCLRIVIDTKLIDGLTNQAIFSMTTTDLITIVAFLKLNAIRVFQDNLSPLFCQFLFYNFMLNIL